MPQSLAQVYLHIVFSTKDRKPYLSDREMRDEMHRYLGGISNELDCPILRVGGVADHVHLLCRLGRSISMSELVKELKRVSSLWIKSKQPNLGDFHWQNGYGVFSISPAHVGDLCGYIENQEAIPGYAARTLAFATRTPSAYDNQLAQTTFPASFRP